MTHSQGLLNLTFPLGKSTKFKVDPKKERSI